MILRLIVLANVLRFDIPLPKAHNIVGFKICLLLHPGLTLHSIMAKKRNQATSPMLAEIIIKGIQEKKGLDIISIDMRKIKNSISDFFIVCHGLSRTQVEAIAGSVEAEVKKAVSQNPWHMEGYENAEWILIDYVDVVVHIFQEEKRKFYNLERLWADAEIREITQEISGKK